MTDAAKLPTYFLSHGGGPWPWMKDEMRGVFDVLEASLKDIPRQIGTKPKAILMISGHWTEREFTVMAHPQPPMIYDYSGFPEHTYHVKYGAPGAPDLARRVQELLAAAGFPAQLDQNRGFDHGAYTVLAPMYPQADVPVVQLSMRRRYDPAAHIEAGRALASLRREGVLILGSGLSFHNLGQMGPQAAPGSREFDQWLNQALVTTSVSERTARLKSWSQAPSARFAHPREDHLIPLMVAVGAAEGEAASVVYHEDGIFGGWSVSSFRFGEAG